MNNLLISIIVPIYNCEKFLDKCITSLINQTYRNLEIILINDGSVDKSLNICKKYKKNDSRIHIINQKNSGAYIARSNGIKIAKGKYFMFVDSDDWLEENAVEILVNKINKYNCDIVKFNGITEPTKKLKNSYGIDKDKFVNKKEILKLLFTTKTINNMCFSIYKNELFNNLKYQNIKLSNCEDLLINMKVYPIAKKVVFIKDILYHYRQNLNSTTKNNDKDRIIKNIEDLVYVHNILLDYVDECNVSSMDFYNQIHFEILKIVYSSLSKLFSCENLHKDEFVKIINTNIDSLMMRIRKNIRINDLKQEIKKENISYKIKHRNSIILLFKKKYNLLWNSRIIYKIMYKLR